LTALKNVSETKDKAPVATEKLSARTARLHVPYKPQKNESPAKPALRALYYTVEVLAPGD
jgi:hypothetical protein